MTDYKNVRYKFTTVTLSGATESSPAEGDIWYASGKYYFGTDQTFSGTWSSGGSLTTARHYTMGCGLQSAALAIGGWIGSFGDSTE